MTRTSMYQCYERHLPIRYNVWATKYNMEVTVMNKYVSLDKRSKKAQREYLIYFCLTMT